MPVRYRRVAQAEAGEEESKKIRAERADRISAKLHALVWVLASIGIIYFTDLFNLVHSDRLNRFVHRCHSYQSVLLHLSTIIFSQIRPKPSNYMLLLKCRYISLLNGMASVGAEDYCSVGCLLPEHDTHIHWTRCGLLLIVYDCVLARLGYLNSTICCHFADWSYILCSFRSLALLDLSLKYLTPCFITILCEFN